MSGFLLGVGRGCGRLALCFLELGQDVAPNKATKSLTVQMATLSLITLT